MLAMGIEDLKVQMSILYFLLRKNSIKFELLAQKKKIGK